MWQIKDLFDGLKDFKIPTYSGVLCGLCCRHTMDGWDFIHPLHVYRLPKVLLSEISLLPIVLMDSSKFHELVGCQALFLLHQGNLNKLFVWDRVTVTLHVLMTVSVDSQPNQLSVTCKKVQRQLCFPSIRLLCIVRLHWLCCHKNWYFLKHVQQMSASSMCRVRLKYSRTSREWSTPDYVGALSVTKITKTNESIGRHYFLQHSIHVSRSQLSHFRGQNTADDWALSSTAGYRGSLKATV